MVIEIEIEERDIFLCKQVDQESILTVIKKIISINNSDDVLEKEISIHGLKYERKPIKKEEYYLVNNFKTLIFT